MKEQIVTPRAGRSLAAPRGRAGEIVQKPARRGRAASTPRGKSSGAGSLLAYLPLAGKITAAVVAGILLFAGYRAAASASFFQAHNIDISGAARSSADQIRTVVQRNVAQTGVWRADLDAISRELKSVSWVREAVVSRVLPDGLRVRIAEREPRAVVRTAAGKFIWVDDEAVALGDASPSDRVFMRGWDEERTEAARALNRERVQKFLEMSRDWDAKGITGRVSEVNLNDLHDVRVQLTGADAQIEIQLGREDFGNRLKFALAELDRQRTTPIGPFILHINVAQGIEKGNHVTIGVSPDAPSLGSAGRDAGGPEVESAKVTARPVARPPVEKRTAKESVARKDDERERKKDQERKEKKDKASPEAKTESRPRRVG